MFKLIFILLAALNVVASPQQASVIKKIDYVDGNNVSFKNYAANSYFEKNSNGVTCTSMTTCAITSTNVLQGVNSLNLNTNSAGGLAKFDVNTFARELYGQNCEFTASIYTNAAGAAPYDLYLENNGSEVVGTRTSMVAQASTTINYSIQYPCGDASSGPYKLVIDSTNSTNFNIYVDNVYAGLNRNISQGNTVTNWTSYSLIIGGTTSAPTVGAGSTSQASWRKVGSNMEIMFSYNATTAGVGGSGAYLFPIPTGYIIDTSVAPITTTLAAATTVPTGGQAVGTGQISNTSAGDTSYNEPVSVFVHDTTNLSASTIGGGTGTSFPLSSSNAQNLGAANVKITLKASVPIVGWSPSNIVRVDQSNFDSVAFTPTTQGFGTLAANSCFYGRDGQEMIIDCKITAGTVSAATAQITLPGGLSVSTSLVPSTRLAKGYWVRSNAVTLTNKAGDMLMNGGDTFISFSIADYTATLNPLSSQLANAIFANGDVISLYARVPIQGWQTNQNAPLLVGSVVSPTSGQMQIVAADINCDASSSINTQSGGISTVANRSGTNCALTIAAGTYSGVPWACQVTVKATAVQATSCGCASTTSCTIYGPSADYDAFVTIYGAR